MKLTGATFDLVDAEETVTLLLREPADLAGVVLEHRAWVPEPPDRWDVVDDGDHAGPSAWTVHPGGDLTQAAAIAGPDDRGTCALAGGPATTDARLVVTLRSDGDGALGAVLRHRDADNGYRFVMRRSAGVGRRRLVCLQDGVARVLWEDGTAFTPGQDAVLVLTAEGTRLTGELDGQELFAVDDATHPTGRLGPCCADNPGAHFGAPAIAEPAWQVYHEFTAEPAALPAGTRVRLHAGPPGTPPDPEPGVTHRFLDAGVRLPAAGAELRLRGGHHRRFRPSVAYAPVDLRILRNADGTGCLLTRPGGAVLEPGEYRLIWTYHRDNRAVDPDAPVMSAGGSSAPERAVLDLPWQVRPAAP